MCTALFFTNTTFNVRQFPLNVVLCGDWLTAICQYRFLGYICIKIFSQLKTNGIILGLIPHYNLGGILDPLDDCMAEEV